MVLAHVLIQNKPVPISPLKEDGHTMNTLTVRTWKALQRGKAVYVDLGTSKPTSIYRYVPLAQLISVIETGTLALNNPSIWPDKTEGGWISRLFSPNAPMEGVHARAICFTRESYSEAQWHVYARSAPVVRVRFNIDSILRSCARFDDVPGKFYLGDVRYTDSAGMKQSLERVLPADSPEPHSRKAAALLLLKRQAFAYEKEVRLIWLTREAVDDHILLPFDVTNAVNQILVSPYAENWAVDAVRSLINDTYRFPWSVEKSSLDRAPSWMT